MDRNKDAAKHLTCTGQSSTTKNYLAQNSQQSEILDKMVHVKLLWKLKGQLLSKGLLCVRHCLRNQVVSLC